MKELTAKDDAMQLQASSARLPRAALIEESRIKIRPRKVEKMEKKANLSKSNHAYR